LPNFSVDASWFLPKTLQISAVHYHEDQVMIDAQTVALDAQCPDCGYLSYRVHSYYRRRPRELPWCGHPVVLHLRVRRFRCVNPSCARTTFAERLPEVVPWHGHRTVQFTETLRQIALVAGGEAGAGLMKCLAMLTSADTILRVLRQTPLPTVTTPRVLGVDDWAIRKGRVYGTILVDMERQQVIDLLPDRESRTLAVWLQQHPGIEIFSRDRAGAYAEGARLGAPEAIQIADRWHLLKNLHEGLAACYERYHGYLSQFRLESAESVFVETSPTSPPSAKRPRQNPPSARKQLRDQHRDHWLAIFEQVHTLHVQGESNKAIARKLNISLKTVRKYRHLSELPPKTSPKPGPRLIDPYRDYLRQRLRVENVPARQLWEEICAQGFSGGKTAVYLCVAQIQQELVLSQCESDG